MGENPLILSRGEGALLKFIGISTVIKVFSDDSDGAYSLIESTVSPRFDGFKPHIHQHMTEAFYILEGTLTFRVGEQSITATPGSFILVPPGMVHTYGNPADMPAKYLLLMSPGGFEQYLIELAQMIEAEPQWPPVDMGKLNALAKKYDATPA